MNFAIYGRKSIYSDRSDSVEAQFTMCRKYIDFKFQGQIENCAQYSDEGYTGANTDRPGLQSLLTDVQDDMVDILVIYRLDRLSRDIRDFSNIYSILIEHNVMFISIRENIDTNTPIGRAMMYVTMVFAQMERETIAERVSDGLLMLAQKGCWTGGIAPIGYKTKDIVLNGKKHVILDIDPKGAQYIKFIFDTFLDNGYSVSRMAREFRDKGIKTINQKFCSTSAIYEILTSPYYAEDTPEIYDYYEALGCQMAVSRDMWNGKSGVMIYGRRNGRHIMRSKDRWTVCPGLHEPFISAERWLAAQSQMKKNVFNKTSKYDTALLKGVVRCKCGCLMRVDSKKLLSGVSRYYACTKRASQGVKVCDMRAIRCEMLDEKVLNILREIKDDPDTAMKYAHLTDKKVSRKIASRNYRAEISNIELKIKKLTSSLSEANGSGAMKYIVKQIEEYDRDMQQIRREEQLHRASERKAKAEVHSVQEKAERIADMVDNFDIKSAAERNSILREVIRECKWDGERLFILL